MCIQFLFYGISCRKEFLVCKHLAVAFSTDRLEPHVHRVGCKGPLKTVWLEHPINPVSPCQWKRADLRSFLVVAFSVNAACATLSPHLSLKSSGVVFECRSLDRKIFGGKISCSSRGPGAIGGSSVRWTSWIFLC